MEHGVQQAQAHRKAVFHDILRPVLRCPGLELIIAAVLPQACALCLGCAQEAFRIACCERRCMSATLHVNPSNLPALSLYT